MSVIRIYAYLSIGDKDLGYRTIYQQGDVLSLDLNEFIMSYNDKYYHYYGSFYGDYADFSTSKNHIKEVLNTYKQIKLIYPTYHVGQQETKEFVGFIYSDYTEKESWTRKPAPRVFIKKISKLKIK